jgi:hypothetical protein
MAKSMKIDREERSKWDEKNWMNLPKKNNNIESSIPTGRHA